jgi:hypothetical protein
MIFSLSAMMIHLFYCDHRVCFIYREIFVKITLLCIDLVGSLTII